jgi:hypothetical protein
MPDSTEQAQMREHLREMRRAVSGLGRDFAIDFETLDEKIDRLGKLTAKEAKYALIDIHDDFASLGRSIDDEIRRLPHQVGAAVVRAGGAIERGATRLGSATGSAVESAVSKASEGTKNAAARFAGVRRTPMKQWHHPDSESEPDSK